MRTSINYSILAQSEKLEQNYKIAWNNFKDKLKEVGPNATLRRGVGLR